MLSIVKLYNRRQKLNTEFRDVMRQAIINIEGPDDINNTYRTDFRIKDKRYLARISQELDGNVFVMIEYKDTKNNVYRPVVVKNQVIFSGLTLFLVIKDFIIDQLITKESLEESDE